MLHTFVAIIKMDTTMKKILLLMAMALPFVFVSCSDDKNEPDTPDNHEYVDLGLPSGTLWATCNVGADSPEQYGDYFSWGEVSTKENYDWPYYKWTHWVIDTISEYRYDIVEVTRYKYYVRNWTDNGYIDGDGKMELEPEDDAAYVNWGPGWRTPTLEQIQELVEKCVWQWTQKNGVNGCQITGPNGKSIFLPAAGARGERLYNDGQCAYYWSRTLCSPEKLRIEAADQDEAYIMFFHSWSNEVWYDSRWIGNPVRAVRASRITIQ